MEGGLEEGAEARRRVRMAGEAVETATAGTDGRRGVGDRDGGRRRPRMGGEAVETATAGNGVRGWEARRGHRDGGHGWEARRGREVTGDALWMGGDVQADARRA
jgi:hypothetical protein